VGEASGRGLEETWKENHASGKPSKEIVPFGAGVKQGDAINWGLN